MRIDRGNQSTQRKSDPLPLCPPQTTHDLGLNLGCRDGKPATNQRYGIVYKLVMCFCLGGHLLYL
jgi:hypothetical protein